MSDDITRALKSAAATPRTELRMSTLHVRARHSRVLRAIAAGTGAVVLAVATVSIVTTLPDGDGAGPPAMDDPTTPAPSETTEPTPTEEDAAPRNLQWPEPFVPTTATSGTRTLMSVVFPDKTAATISYPSELQLAQRGVQVAMSYTFEDAKPNTPYDIIFIPGEAPEGLLDPQPLQTFDGMAFPAAVHAVTYEYLRGDPPFALVYETEGWTIVATLPEQADADTVVRNLHPSVTAKGWPSVFASGPLQLSEGFGEARGPHVEIGDRDPIFDVVDAGDDFTYIVMGPSTDCDPKNDAVDQTAGDWYGARCLVGPTQRQRVFASIYGPNEFVRSVFEGIELVEQ